MIHFGTGGWRGIIGDDFIKSNIRQLALMIAHIAYEDTDVPNPIAIGYDNRFLSKDAAEWMIEVFNKYGISTYSFETSVPTPFLMHYVKINNLDYGVMITASHNPYNYNGVKLIVKGGLDAPESLTNRFEDAEADWSLPIKEVGSNVTVHTSFKSYLDELLNVAKLEGLEYNKLNIAFDGMHGSGSPMFIELLKQLNVNYETFAINVDPLFDKGAPEPSEDNCEDFHRWYDAKNAAAYVTQQLQGDSEHKGFDLGLVFDGDGDRLLVYDECGHAVTMNKLLCVFYYYLHTYCGSSGTVIKNTVTTFILDKMADTFGDKCVEVPVGFKWITSSMTAHNALLGGESSGGFALRNHIYGKDALLAAVLLMRVIAHSRFKLSELIDIIEQKFGKSIYIEKKISLTSAEQKSALVDYINSLNLADCTVSEIDGKKFIRDNCWVSFRFSGTEPILRITAEAESQYAAEELIKEALAAIKM